MVVDGREAQRKEPGAQAVVLLQKRIGNPSQHANRVIQSNPHTTMHHRTATTVHGDQPKVMKLLGDMSGNEMIISSYAKHLSTCFGPVQAAPIAIGARGNGSELITLTWPRLPSIARRPCSRAPAERHARRRDRARSCP